MPHTDTNISRDALRSYGMQPSGRQDSRQRGKEADKERRFMVYGDAAVNPAVAAKKVKRESAVAGRANVVIWPDLNVGNVGVKLIQQFGHADAYGPMLQGFDGVICDCSRGAPVSEIKGNIIISAVRAAGLAKGK